MPPDPSLLAEIKDLLRRDLKLGPDAAIADDMPLVGGENDFDSIDLLLLISTLEKQFGLSIASEQVGREAFETVSTLAAFVAAQRSAAKPAAPQPAPAEVGNWIERLPHGPAARYVTRVESVEPGRRCRAAWAVSGGESFFAGHFPGRPIVPGVLIVEALAQTAGLATGSGGEVGVIARVDVRFESPVAPPAEILLAATVADAAGPARRCDVAATVAGRVVASGSITLHVGKRGGEGA